MKKIKIKALPEAKYGGHGFNQMAPNAIPDQVNEPPIKVGKTLYPVPRMFANLEAEKGETAVLPDKNGMIAQYNIAGKKHSEGGTPLNLPDDSFIFSDTKKMTLRDPLLLNEFNEKKPKTFAKIAKKYDVNNYREMLSDPNSDKLQRETSEMMVENYTAMLGKLGLAQESQKGFPQGIPFISEPYMASSGILPEQILPAPNSNTRKLRVTGTPGQGFQSGGQAGGLTGNESFLTPEEAARIKQEKQNEELLAIWNESGQATNPAPVKGNAKTSTPVVQTPPKTSGTNKTKGYNPDRSRKDTYEYNKQFTEAYLEAAKKGEFAPELPSTYQPDATAASRERDATQRSLAGVENVYGDKSQVVDDFADFQKRHAWYFKNKPNWSFNNKQDVRDFQETYNKKAGEYGLPAYFTTNGPQGTKLDSLWGEHTWSAPGFNTPASPGKTKVETKTDAGQPDIATNMLQYPPTYNPFEYYPQDTANLATAMLQQIPKMKTFYAPTEFQGFDPAYVKEDYSPIMESANISTQGVNAYGSRQRADGSLSKIQGQAARAAADHNLQVANLNVGIYNEADRYNASVANENAKYNSMLKQVDFDAREAYAADRVKARNKKAAEVMSLANNRLTNAADTYNLNLMNPNYKVFPGTGGLIAFTKGEMLKPDKDALMSTKMREFTMWKQNTNLTDDQIVQLMRAKAEGSYPQDQYFNPYGAYPG